MKRMTPLISLLIFVFACCVTVSVVAQEAPATRPDQAQAAPQMPEGHPPIPQGHPPMPKAKGPLPQGHPPVTTQPAEPVVYETTDIEPDWYVAVRHLIVRPMKDQLHVTEVWAVVNPTEKSYIGKTIEAIPAENSDQVPVDPKASVDASVDSTAQTQPEDLHSKGGTTLVLPLPPNANHVQPGRGFDACCVQLENGKLIISSPMIPGTNEMHVSYLLKAESGVFILPLTAPSATKHMMVFLPDDGSEVTATGLTAGDPFIAGDKQFRMYMGKQIEKGVEMGLTIKAKQTVAENTAVTPAAAIPPTDNAGQIKTVAVIGGGVLLLAALIVMIKPARKPMASGAAG